MLLYSSKSSVFNSYVLGLNWSFTVRAKIKIILGYKKFKLQAF